MQSQLSRNLSFLYWVTTYRQLEFSVRTTKTINCQISPHLALRIKKLKIKYKQVKQEPVHTNLFCKHNRWMNAQPKDMNTPEIFISDNKVFSAEIWERLVAGQNSDYINKEKHKSTFWKRNQMYVLERSRADLTLAMEPVAHRPALWRNWTNNPCLCSTFHHHYISVKHLHPKKRRQSRLMYPWSAEKASDAAPPAANAPTIRKVSKGQDWTIFLWGSKTYLLKCKWMLMGWKSALGSSSFVLLALFPFFLDVEEKSCLVSGRRPSEENIDRQVINITKTTSEKPS